jgi:hypothetical protein
LELRPKKQRHLTASDDPRRVGDVWTFVALDADTKLVPCYRIGKRDLPTASAFLADLSDRLVNRVQLSSDVLAAYVEATEQAFGSDVDYGQIVKAYEAEPIGPGRYSPPHVVSADTSAFQRFRRFPLSSRHGGQVTSKAVPDPQPTSLASADSG